MNKVEHVKFSKPSEVRKFPKGRVELVKIGGGMVGRAIFQPGWRWSEHIKPIAKTKSCLAPHLQYHLSGILKIKMDNGVTKVFKAGDVSYLPSGHDAWVVGKKPAVVIDFHGMGQYAKRK